MGFYGLYRVLRDMEYDRRHQERSQKSLQKAKQEIQDVIGFLSDATKANKLLKQIKNADINKYSENYEITVRAMSIIENSKPVKGYSFVKSNFKNTIKYFQKALDYVKQGDIDKANIYANKYKTNISELFSEHGPLSEIIKRYNLNPFPVSSGPVGGNL